MIALERVSKRYVTDGVPGPWVLHEATLSVPARTAVAVLGAKGAGKSTLLQLVIGAEQPTEGRVLRQGRVSEPNRYLRNLQPLLTGRQNARFICRVSGHDDDLEERLARIEQIARLGSSFDQPAKGYKPQMRARLSFALSWALDSEIYVADNFNFAGETGFADKETADAEFARKAATTTFLLTARGAQPLAALAQRCTCAIWVHDGQAQWFDRVGEAMAASGSARQKQGREEGRPQPDVAAAVPPAFAPALAGIKRLQNALSLLARGLQGQPATVERKHLARMLRLAKDVGLELASREQMAEQGLAPAAGSIPVLKAGGAEAEPTDYYDPQSQGATLAAATVPGGHHPEQRP